MQQQNNTTRSYTEMQEPLRTTPRALQDVGGELGALVLGTPAEVNQPTVSWPTETARERIARDYDPRRGINHANIRAGAESARKRIEEDRQRRVTAAYRKSFLNSLEVIYQHQPEKNPFYTGN